ncbi:MAG TPA: hypothetical protein VMF91_13340 [Bryobacteraceae bacterium]|nr:hypothetical protein [Bryobacteraceae bacterium]
MNRVLTRGSVHFYAGRRGGCRTMVRKLKERGEIEKHNFVTGPLTGCDAIAS